MFPIDSLKENVFLYFWYTTRANTVLSITAKPVHSTSQLAIIDKALLKLWSRCSKR